MEDQDEDHWIAVTDIVANDFLCVFELTSSLKGFSQPGLPWYKIVIFTCGQTWIHQKILVAITLVTQPMLQCWPNCTEIKSMDSYIQILCRFQKCKQKVPPPLLIGNKKTHFFSKSLLRGDGGETFCLHFRNLQKIWW